MTELTKKFRKTLKRILRQSPSHRNRFDPLEQKLYLKERIEEVTRDGMIGLDWDKMDCDSARWGGHSHIRATVTHYRAWESDFYDWAEGPQNVFIVEPEKETGKSWERDLALEAFENGHPHCIHY